MRTTFPRSRIPLLASSTLLLAFAGCSSSPSPQSTFIAQADPTAMTGATIGTRSVRGGEGGDLSLALAQMPEPGGSQVALREKTYSNGLKQDIVLGGDRSPFGDNVLSVAVQATPLVAGASGGVPVYPPSERGIKSEILARYPSIDMQILTQPRRNGLGTFGLAIGRHASGVRCVYAWQFIEDVRNPGASSSSTLSKLGSFGSTAQPALIRVNMCRKDATVDDLAMAVEGLQLAPASVIDRALDASRATASVSTRPAGSGGVAVAASDGSLEGALTTSVRSRVASAPGGERKRVARRAKKPAEAEESVAQQSPVAPAMPAAPMYQGGPRYLAPIAGGAPSGGAPATTAYNAQSYAAPVPGYGSGPTTTKSLDPSLPAAAYRGPGGGGR